MSRWFNRHNSYLELVTEHLDGVLDEAGTITLRRHLESCSECATELREQGAVRELLRAELLVEPPRSFALPYASRQEATEHRPGVIGWAGGGVAAALRGMQVATASVALVLVALIALNVADTGPARSQTTAPQPEAADASAPESLGAAVPTLESDGSLSIRIAADSAMAAASAKEEGALDALAPEPVGPPIAESTPMPLNTESRVSQLPDDARISLAAPAPGVGLGGALPDASVEDSRSAFDWVLLALAALTAAFALGVVALTWSLRRPS